MAKKINKKLFQVVPQYEEVSHDEEVGTPLVEFFARPSEAKKNFLNTIEQLSGYAGVSDDGDDEAYSLLDDKNDSEVDAFNNAFKGSPYAVDDKGIANYEKVFAQNKEQLAQFRSFMSMKDIPEFQQLAEKFQGMNRDDIARVIQGMMNAGTPPKGSDGEPNPDGVPE